MRSTARPAVVFAALLLFAACGNEGQPAGDEEAADTTHAAGPSIGPAAPTGQAADVVALLQADPRFSTLVAALDSAGLAASLRGSGPFTVFAPTDDAFAALPAGTLDDLLRPESRDRLLDLLLLHVVQGTYRSDALGDTTLMAQQGGMLQVRTDGDVTVRGIVVDDQDLGAGNGVVHVLTGVLSPGEDR